MASTADDYVPLKTTGTTSLLDLYYHGLETAPSLAAVRFDDGNLKTELSYSDLDIESGVIAAHLAALAVESEIICISSTKHVSSISIIVGILKTSAAFCFVNFNDMPPKNISWYLQQLGSCYVFVPENELKGITDRGFNTEVVSKIECKAGTLNLAKVGEAARKKYCYPDWSLAYAIQTSGSTGASKVVKVPHRCILANIIHFRNEYRVTPRDVVFVAAPFTFDPGMVDIFLALSSGACALLMPEAVKAIPRRLIEILTERNKATMMQVTPSVLRMCGAELLRTSLLGADSPLRILGLGGEVCPSKSTLLAWKSPDCRVKMYNVYGLTEMSAWSTMHPIDFACENEEIPLGKPIMDSEILIMDMAGRPVKSAGTGQVYLGGRNRMCFIGEEDHTEASKSPMRATGDLVRLTADGQLFYVGRFDDIIKRFGKKIFPKQIEKITKSLPEIEDCHVLFNRAKDHLIAAIVIRQEHKTNTSSVKEKLKNMLIDDLPSYAVPDRITAVTSFPVTSHGKINKRLLLEIAYLQDELADVAGLTRETICNKVEQMWTFNVGSTHPVHSSDNFSLAGGDSLKAVYLCDQVQLWLGMACPLLMEKLLNSNFLSVCDYLVELVKSVKNSSAETRHENTIANMDQKILPSYVEAPTIMAISRGNARSHNSSMGNIISRDPAKTVLSIRWRYNTNKCVDASPLVVSLPKGSVVFIGSHSHYFYAISVEDGRPIWSFKAGDRIESSACANCDGKRIFFGSYDQHLYCLDANSGNQLWKFRSEGIIKSSPAYDSLSRLVYFGSYDHFVYALNSQNGECIWKTQLGLGSVFSSVCLCYSPHQIYVGTLDGILGALHPQSGKILWKTNLNSPIFSSCAVVPHGICVGCVDHTLNCLDHRGNKMWTYRSKGPVFSSITVAQLESTSAPLVIFGSHDNKVHCLQAETGQLRWKVALTSAVYSTAFVCGEIVFTCSTDGVLRALSLDDGKILSKYEFPGETFSSPVIFQNQVLVGCRDNFLYCLDVSEK